MLQSETVRGTWVVAYRELLRRYQESGVAWLCALRDAQLGALLDNGGAMPTSLPGAASPLLDQGSCPGESRDQRGYANSGTGLRPVPVGGGVIPADDGCDNGAVERLATPSDIEFRDGFETL